MQDFPELWDGNEIGRKFSGEMKNPDVLILTPGNELSSVVPEIFLLPGRDLRILRFEVGVRAGPDEHAYVRGAGLSLRVAHVRGARNPEGLSNRNLRVALGTVDHDRGDGSRLVEELAAVRFGFCGRDHVEAVCAFGDRAAAREQGAKGSEQKNLLHCVKNFSLGG